jgi:hypothetical protein
VVCAMTEEDWQNNEEDDLEDEIVAMIMVREQMQAALEALEVKLDRAKSKGATTQKIAELEAQHHEQASALEDLSTALDQRGIEFLISSHSRRQDD